jgi:membrane-bound lytic murein transglycosylase MltF
MHSAGALAQGLAESVIEPWYGDFEDMLEKREIRALVVYNKLLYFLDGPRQHGASYDALEQFRAFVDDKYDLKARKFNIVYIPVTRDKLIPYLRDGLGDIAVANLTVTPERREQIDFSDPIITGVKEVLVTGPSAPEILGLEDLAGKKIHVRKSSSYHTHLQKMSQQLVDHGLQPIQLVLADEYLEDSDLLEMVNAGLLPMIIVDSHKAAFWKNIFENITVRMDIAITVEGSIAWAFRQDSPTLKNILDQFVAANKKGTLIGNTIYKRYLQENKWVRNALQDEDLDRYNAVSTLFQEYAEQYDFDYLMLLALAYQESRLDHNMRSSSGAVGIMQMLPSTAKDPNVDINDIEDLENNIHAGTKYLRFVRDTYFSDSDTNELNKTLLSFASYNAGPNRIAAIRKETRERGLDPNVWFGNVEHIVARRIGRETVQYVANIYKYYIAYRLLAETSLERKEAREKLEEKLE